MATVSEIKVSDRSGNIVLEFECINPDGRSPQSQLRNAATRLQKAQAKFEHNAQVARKEIAVLLDHELRLRSSMNLSNEAEKEKLLSVARLKAEKLMADDRASDLMEILERYCDVLIEGHLPERSTQLDGDCLEAVSGIIAASSRIDSSELLSLGHSLVHRYQDLTPECVIRQYVPPKFAAYLNPVRPAQSAVDSALVSIASGHGVPTWRPPQLLLDDRRQELINLLDATSWISVVEVAQLRRLCASGIPDTPAWLRIRAWGILLGTLPNDKGQWSNSRKKEKADYVALAEPLLVKLSNRPAPSSPLTTQDKTIHQFSKEMESLPPSIRNLISEIHISEPLQVDPRCLLQHGDAVRLRVTQLLERNQSTKISRDSTIPSITLDNPPLSPPTSTMPKQVASPTTVLLPSSSGSPPTAYDDILFRLLFIHSSIHASHALSMGPSPALAAIFALVLAVALSAHYSTIGKVSQSEYEESMLGIEAEVFWMVEAIISRVMELLEPEEDGEDWATKFSRMTQWADRDLWTDLSKKGLDPALPYYSYRWIPTLFTHALPTPTLLPVWDALLSATYLDSRLDQHRTPPQSNFIYTIGTAMLIRARAAIFQSTTEKSPTSAASASGSLVAFWRRQTGVQEIQLPRSPSPYSPVASPKTPQSPTMGAVPMLSTGWDSPRPLGHMTPGTAGNVFLASVKLLQDYDVEAYGGIDRLLDSIWTLWRRWNREEGAGMLSAPKLTQEPTAMPASQTQDTPSSGSSGGVLGGLSKLGTRAWMGIVSELGESSDSASPPEDEVPLKKAPPENLLAPEVTVTSPTTSGPATSLFASFGSGLGSQLTETVWKGVTNQVDTPDPSPEVSPTPSSVASPILVAHDEKAPPLQEAKEGDATTSWAAGYAERWRDSDTAASLLRTGTNLRVRAMDAWNRRSAQPSQPSSSQEDTLESTGVSTIPETSPVHNDSSRPSSISRESIPPSISSRGSWGDIFTKRGSLPLVGSWVGDPTRKLESEKGQDTTTSWESGSSKHTSYSPPSKPAHFRVVRDSMFGTAFGTSPSASLDMAYLPTAPPTDPDAAAKNPLQAALASLTGTTKSETPKRGPKPLLLNSNALITPSGTRSSLYAGTPSRTPSRRPSPSPTPRVGERMSLPVGSWNDEEAALSSASGFVSLRRGPITSPRTAGYPGSRRDTTYSSQDSRSSMPTPPPAERAFSVDMGGNYNERALRQQGSISNKSGFFIDRRDGDALLRPKVQLRDEGFQPSSAESSRESSPYRGRRYTADGQVLKANDSIPSNRRNTKLTTISTYGSPTTIPELAVITPGNEDKLVTSPNSMVGDDEWPTSEEHGNTVDSGLEDGGVLPVQTSGTKLSRVRTPLRRKPRESADGLTKGGRNSRTSRFVSSRSGSEEEVQGGGEDLGDIYEMY